MNPSSPDVCRRAWLAGMSTENRKYVGLVLRPIAPDGHSYGEGAVLPKLEAACLRAARNIPIECLAARFERDVRVILAMPIGADENRLIDEFAPLVREGAEVAIATGASVTTLKSVDLSLREAMDVMSAVHPDSDMGAVFRLTNMRIRGLLTLLSGDSRLTDFAERELGLLQQESALCRIDLVQTALVLIENWHSKSLAAKRLHVSRPVLYDRIRKVETILGESLESGELRTSLHVAILSKSLVRASGVNAW